LDQKKRTDSGLAIFTNRKEGRGDRIRHHHAIETDQGEEKKEKEGFLFGGREL